MLPKSEMLLRQSVVRQLLASDTAIEMGWRVQAYRQFEQVLSDQGFPCLFGRRANKSGSCLLLFIPEKHERQTLCEGLQAYVNFVNETPLEDRLFNPLIVIFEKNDFNTLAEEQAHAWAALQYLHDEDSSPWPAGACTDPETFEWTYHFAGLPLFINMSFPRHTAMKSRSLGGHIVFVINPRENFDQVASAETESGRKIRERIRQRIADYNKGVMPDTLGFFGDRESLEWKQYQLYEKGGLSLSKCPLHIKVNTTDPFSER
ncbi:YqcI/YcgG family protein [Pseudomonas syringae]|uniref:YqcI/YcgG family protein n=1 Tax=Pseudomonas syringae TaxID=317 RepID=UPI0004165FA8|nr:YqcI/YcgG family protein [Pseudomonas syringae]